MNFITFYASDGSLHMPQDEKSAFRQWAYEELKNAFYDYEIQVSTEPNTKQVDLYSHDQKISSSMLGDFIENMIDRWYRLHGETKRGE